jgi:hypothetical protein
MRIAHCRSAENHPIDSLLKPSHDLKTGEIKKIKKIRKSKLQRLRRLCGGVAAVAFGATLGKGAVCCSEILASVNPRCPSIPSK